MQLRAPRQGVRGDQKGRDRNAGYGDDGMSQPKTNSHSPNQLFDLEAAAKLLKLEAFGDWYRDPWAWFELDESLMPNIDLDHDLGFKKVVDKSIGGYSFDVTPAFHLLTVPKSFTGVRPGVVIDPSSKLVYTAAAAQLATRLHSDLPDWVYGWRLRDGQPSSTTDEWDLYTESVGSIHGSRWALQTDITSFFASTDVDNLVADIKATGGRTAATDAVEQVLGAHRQLSERRGLPQRCYASSYLANLAVRAVDDTVAAAMADGRIHAARRWMDDISVESEELQELYRLIIDIQAAMRRAGLEINTSKTHLTNGKRSHALLKADSPEQMKLRSLAIANDYADLDDDDSATPIDFGPLERAEDRLLKNPKSANRGEGAMVLKALRKYEKTDRYLEWRNIAHQLPHLADTLGRYFALAIRDNRRAKGVLDRWFTLFEGSQWASVDWVAAQYGMMFASDNLPPGAVKIIREWLAHSRSLQQVSVAAQRLAASQPQLARTAMASRSNTEADPHIQRVLALGLASAGASQRDVARLLGRSPHHRLTVKALNKGKWQVPKASNDFDPIASKR